MPPTPDAAHAPTARFSGRVHRSTPLIATSRKHQYPAPQGQLAVFAPVLRVRFLTARLRTKTERGWEGPGPVDVAMFRNQRIVALGRLEGTLP
ncbi:hypothetical protein AB0903_23615 [Streptomyces sp. NPDC048389]|uniref:hypothetical protein n=1 Tax=Streptomyces sp. NPDC048389 TaxID=3154622 RepID=UPI003455A2CB